MTFFIQSKCLAKKASEIQLLKVLNLPPPLEEKNNIFCVIYYFMVE